MVWTNQKHGGHELQKIYHLLPPYTRGRVLDIASGWQRMFPHWTMIDNGHDYAAAENFSVDLNWDASGRIPFEDGAFDAVVSSHFLEHLENPQAALAEWWRMVKVGGHLALYLPHRDLYPHAGTPGANIDHKHDFWPTDIERMMHEITGGTDIETGAQGWDLIENETRDGGDEYSFFQVYRKRADNQTRDLCAKPREAKGRLLIARPGAIGDVMLATAAVDALMARGWRHIDFMTTKTGAELLRHDPRVNVIELDDEQIPAANWVEFVRRLAAERYEHFINYTNAIEGRLLFMRGSVEHAQADGPRRAIATKGYLEYAADLAGVLPAETRIRFVPSEEEHRTAQSIARRWPRPLVLWMLGGSSIHKEWPHIGEAITWLFRDGFPGAILAAGDASLTGTVGHIIKSMREGGLGPEAASRFMASTGDLTIRQIMALAQEADLIIGPETGVLMAMAHEAMPKIVLMSHSAPHNLTAGWRNTQSITPRETPCYPCHRLHNLPNGHPKAWDFCHRGVTTPAALCAENITANDVLAAIHTALPMTMARKALAS